MESTRPKQRAIVYIDGYNLYYAIKKAELRQYLWLDLNLFASKLVLDHQTIVLTKYFTSVEIFNPESRERQERYFDALSSLSKFKRYLGRFQKDADRWCIKCHAFVPDTREKKTDVNLATELLVDAFTDKFDVAILVSCDSDYTSPIQYVLRNFRQKRIFAAVPIWRRAKALRGVCSGIIDITREMLCGSQFPDVVQRRGAPDVMRPDDWREPITASPA
jgi:uncharacterized LabA/DUF88 family protein